MMKLSVITPAFNEEKTISTILDRVLEFNPDVHEVIVVDDASTDETAERCLRKAAKEPRIKLIRHRVNMGKTAALRSGFAACTGEIVVVQDADLEYHPQEIPELISPIREGLADVCLGSRFLIRKAGRVLYYRHYLANKFLTCVSNLITDLNLTDVETGYKAMKSEIARNVIIRSSGFGIEIELIAKCRKLGARMFEVPISYYGRTYQEGKKIGVKDGIDALWFIFRFNLFTPLKKSFNRDFLEEKQLI